MNGLLMMLLTPIWLLLLPVAIVRDMMAAKFKCKRCKQVFDLNDGREKIQDTVQKCEKPTCPLRNRSLSYIPKKKETILLAANDEVVEEYLEEEPIGGLISHREIRKKYGL